MINNSINFKGSFYIDLTKCKDSKRYEAYGLTDITDEEGGTAYFSENSPDYYATCSIPDSKDFMIETYLKNLGIKYKKLTQEELYSEKAVKARIQVPEHRIKTHKIVNIDPGAFEEVFKKEDTYLGKYPMDNPERYDGFIDYLKSYQPIDASEVYLSEENGTPSVSFQDGRHRYCVYRDMGYSSIPVAMDEKSIQIARKYNLLVE